jgi:hypothetical protein
MDARSRQTMARKRYALGAGVGGLVGCAATFVYLNVDPFERMVAQTDGFPRWSLWHLPFTLPGAAAGALLGAVVVLLARLLGRRTGTV